MNQPRVPPRTMSDAKCFLTAKRDAQTVVARPYDRIGTTSGRGYSCATTEAKAQELIACPDGNPEFQNELFSPQNPPWTLPSKGRSRRVVSLIALPRIVEFASASNPKMPVSRKRSLFLPRPMK